MERTCPDCNGELAGIKLIGRGWENPLSKLAIDTELDYFTEAEADRNGFSGMFRPKGRVESFLCGACGRIFLYGIAD